MLVGAELEGLALASVPRLEQAGLSEHVTLIYVMHGSVADLRLDSTCPPSNKPSLLPYFLVCLLDSVSTKCWRKQRNWRRVQRMESEVCGSRSLRIIRPRVITEEGTEKAGTTARKEVMREGEWMLVVS